MTQPSFPRPRTADNAAWQPWRLDRAAMVLFLPSAGNATDDASRGHLHAIQLDRCRTPAGFVNAITAVAGRTFADDATLAGLVRALDDVLRPRLTMTGINGRQELTRFRLRARVAGAVARTGVAR